jgi:glycosyltransferase domain-containing protein
MGHAQAISILIPTLNRSEFLIRALRYYHTIGFTGALCIGDSSNDEHTARIKNTIEQYQDRLRIVYQYFPSPPYTNDALCLKELIELAPSPYAAYSGDDDFLIPSTLEKCAQFLDTHPDYSAVNGVSVAVHIEDTNAYGNVVSADYIGKHQLESDKATERWIGYMRQSISTQYYVHRIETWRKMYEYVPTVPLRYLGPELLPCSFSAILGKITEIDSLACVFQANDPANKNFGWYTHSMYELLTHPNWTTAARAMRESIVQALVEQDALSSAEAQKIFDQEFWRHLLFMLEWHYRLHHAEPLNVYDALKRKTWLVNGYMRLKQLFAGKDHRPISLATLLKPSSPYHADFMPIYDIITAPPN